MPQMIRPPDSKDETTYLRMLFLKTERRLIAEINRKRSQEYVDYAEVAALNRTQQILQEMVDESWSYVPAMIEKIFYKSEAAANGYKNAAGLTASQLGIVQQLSNNLLGDIVEASVTAQESIEESFQIGRREADKIREAALKSVVETKATGYGTGKAAASMSKELRSEGITAFVDKAGRKWGLQDYCNMATRATARQAEVSAILTADPDHDLYKIVKIGSTCPICAPLEGRIYSRSGTNPDYPPLASAFGKIDPNGSNDLSNTYLNIHPNCLHALVKYTTIGKSEAQIQRDKDFSSFEKNPITVDPRSKKQIAAYKEKVKNRQKLLSDYKQHERYRAVLGNDVPKSFEKFRELKYNDGEGWKSAQALYRKTNTYNKIILKEPGITADLKKISNNTGVTMVGLEYRLKSKESFLRKVGTESEHSLDPQRIKDTISSTNDVIRYTYQDNPLTLVDSYKNIAGALQEKGYDLVRVKNFWHNKGNPYNGINCTFRVHDPEGKWHQDFEVQFHTPESYGVKDRMHKDYEAWRLLDAASPEAIALRRKMMEQSRGMEIPANIEEVKNK
ncbi:phage minor capsid protein [Lacrimispora indolis]|uniref:phage minor capsid protein n=1 Tax=Lacrimispora indolis TaxID=69825 RepID=UPI0004139EAE|nr:phage minor capsid protein [[Clostridium] methoxybenzovorans]